MDWIFLLIAGICEIIGVTAFRLSNGFKRKRPIIFAVPIGLLSFYLLSVAMKTIPVSTAYAVWTGTGAVGTVIVGIVFFREAKSGKRLFFLTLIIIGIVGLRLSGGESF